MSDPWAENAFERGVDSGEQSADTVADAGGLPGEIVVEPDEHLELGQGFVTDIDPAQRVRHGPGSIGDDERIAGIGLGLSGVQVGDAAHRQARQVGHGVAAGAGDGDRQGTDGVRLVDDHQHRAVFGQAVEHSAEFGLVVGQGFVEQSSAGGVESDGVVFAFAHVDAAEHGVGGVHEARLSFRSGRSPIRRRYPAPTLRGDLPDAPAQQAAVSLSAVHRRHQVRRHHPPGSFE